MINIRELNASEKHAVEKLRANVEYINYLKNSKDVLIAALIREKSVNEMTRLQGQLITLTQLLETIEG